MNVFVLSTMTQSVGYAIWRKVDGLPTMVGKITIHGGAGIPSLRSGFGDMTKNAEGQPLWTADGIVTSVKEEDYEILKDQKIFKKHMEDGLVKVIQRDIRDNHKEVKKHANDMSRDAFRVLDKDTLKLKVKVTTASAPVEQEFRM